jgi:hypothetical protein
MQVLTDCSLISRREYISIETDGLFPCIDDIDVRQANNRFWEKKIALEEKFNKKSLRT